MFAQASLAAQTRSEPAKTKAELAKIVSIYQLGNTVRGNCPASIRVVKESFNNTKVAALGIYGNQPGDVVIQLEDLNDGRSIVQITNPMTGAPNGAEISESAIGNGRISGYFENDDTPVELRFRYDFSATYARDTLSYEVKYENSSADLRFDNACEYSRQ